MHMPLLAGATRPQSAKSMSSDPHVLCIRVATRSLARHPLVLGRPAGAAQGRGRGSSGRRPPHPPRSRRARPPVPPCDLVAVPWVKRRSFMRRSVQPALEVVRVRPDLPCMLVSNAKRFSRFGMAQRDIALGLLLSTCLSHARPARIPQSSTRPATRRRSCRSAAQHPAVPAAAQVRWRRHLVGACHSAALLIPWHELCPGRCLAHKYASVHP